MLTTTETEAADGRTANGGRWGNKRVDGRDWAEYNEELVVRGEFLLPVELLLGHTARPEPTGNGRWREELEGKNGEKVGRAGRRHSYEFPDFLFAFLAILHQWMDYRALEGLCRSLAGLGIIPAYPDYATVWRRVGRTVPEIVLPSAEEMEAAVDATGLRAGSAGEYRYQMYGGTRRKFVKVVIMVDVRRKLPSSRRACKGGRRSHRRSGGCMRRGRR
ncbi:MAG: transposase [Conexivisphaera sp.]